MDEDTHNIRFFVASLTILAITLSILAHLYSRFPGDLQLTLLFQSVHSNSLLAVMKVISYITDGWRAAIIVIIGSIISWHRLGRLEGSLVMLAGLSTFTKELFKVVINRPRPTADLVSVFVAESGKSFPSGHALFAVVVLGFLGYLAVTNQHKHALRILTLSTVPFLILWIGASRIYIGTHWVSDVIGGYVIGSLFLVMLIWLYQILKSRFRARRLYEK